MTDLAAALRAGPLVLDGGLGTLLEARGHDLASALWSARLLRDDPDAVRRAHSEFVEAGADVLITSSYQLAYGGPIDDAEVTTLLTRSVALAREAGDVFVAASVGPFGAARADGSEYRGDYGVDAGFLARWHRRRLQVLAAAQPDVLAVETIPCIDEVEALVSELDALGVPAWISLSASSAALSAAPTAGATSRTIVTDDALADALRTAASARSVIAVGVNCCPPDRVRTALDRAPDGIDLVAYPNSGESWDADARRWRGRPGIPTESAHEWIAAGARLVGGCCRTTPGDIADLAAAVHHG
jgi:homocysteine S-methyltransferase